MIVESGKDAMQGSTPDRVERCLAAIPATNVATFLVGQTKRTGRYRDTAGVPLAAEMAAGYWPCRSVQFPDPPNLRQAPSTGREGSSGARDDDYLQQTFGETAPREVGFRFNHLSHFRGPAQ